MGGKSADNRPSRERLVRSGYDRIAEHYLASKEPLDSEAEEMLTRLLQGSPDDTSVLDLGCGAGVPVTQWLAARRPVVGVDLSLRQLQLARRHVPGADLIQADMTQLAFPAESFGAVVAMYAIIHVPREKHRPLLERIHHWLRPGGGFLATWPMNHWEGEEADWLSWGAPMWWSHFGRDANLAMIEAAGFDIELAQDRHGDENWCWVLARKPT
jgi:SAM-dependent methyltransferase